MPGCSVMNCSNRSRSPRLFRIPCSKSNVERTNLWLKLINCPEFAKHFSETLFENARKDGRKLLKPHTFLDLLIPKQRKLNEDESPEVVTPNQSNMKIDADNAVNSDFIEIKLELEEELDISEIVERTTNNVENMKKKLKAALRKCRHCEKKAELI